MGSRCQESAVQSSVEVFRLGERTISGVSGELGVLADALERGAEQVESCEQTARVAAHATHQGRQRLARVQDALSNLTQVTEALQAAVEHVSRIEERSAVIHDIAFQSHVLSVNASIEAARAGEQGRGFSVVASSMRELAKQSAEAAEDIEQIVTQGVSSIQEAANNLSSQLHENHEAMGELDQTFRSVEAEINGVEQGNDRIAGQSRAMVLQMRALREKLLRDLEDHARAVSNAIGELTDARITDVQPRQAHAELSSYEVRIDVRSPTEFAEDLGRIEGAINVPIGDDFLERVAPYVRPDARTLVISRRGGRSARGCRMLQELGIRVLHNLDGGMLAWTEERLPTAPPLSRV